MNELHKNRKDQNELIVKSSTFRNQNKVFMSFDKRFTEMKECNYTRECIFNAMEKKSENK